MKKYLLLLMAAAAAGTLSAAPRTLSEAQSFAQDFLSQKLGHTAQLSPMSQPLHARGLEAGCQPFYAFNDEAGQAFVIVSGSDLMRPVIGYSTSGTLPADTEALPDNVRSWLEWLGEAAQYLEQHPEAALTAQQMGQSFEPIEPLMKSTWNQTSPYNSQCPSGCPVGCVATATAQVFRYHFAKLGEVVRGTGSHSYKYKNKTYSVDYSEQTYDYSLLPLKATGASTAQKKEIAKLCYHVGVGLNMQYATDGSGTLDCYIPRLATEHFGFNSLTSYVERSLFSYDEWLSILLGELGSEHPVVYGGQSSEGGHAFVLEGLDSDGLFYINWGWGGHYDGYFDVTVCNPGGAGTGAVASDDGFCMMQDAIVNLCYEEGAGRYYTPLQIGGSTFSCSKSSVNKGQSVTLTAQSLYNYSAVDQKGYVGLVLMQGDEVIQRTESSTLVSATGSANYSIYGTGQVKRSITFDASLPDGTYQLWMYYQPKGKDYYDMLRATHTKQSYFTVEVSGNTVSLSHPSIENPLMVSNWTWETQQIETRPTTLTCDLYNPSDESFVAQYLLTFIDPDGKRSDPVNAGTVVVVAPGETRQLSFDYHFTKVGHWKAEMDIIRQNFTEETEPFMDADGEFDVVLNETMGADFLMTKNIEQVSDTVYLNREATFRLKLKNSGAPYNGKIGIRFFAKNNSAKATSEFFCDATFEGDTEDFIEVTGLITDLKEKTKYYARAYYLYDNDYVQIDAKSGVSGYLLVPIYPEPEQSGIADITIDGANDLSKAEIYNIVGRRVALPANGKLPRGIYIIDGKKTVIR